MNRDTDLLSLDFLAGLIEKVELVSGKESTIKPLIAGQAAL
jgi:hypothetical protein